MFITKGCLGKLIRPKIFTSKNISNKPKQLLKRQTAAPMEAAAKIGLLL